MASWVVRSLAVVAILIPVLQTGMGTDMAHASPHSAIVTKKAVKVAQVHYISGGLGVQPPQRTSVKGRLKMSLFTHYALHTRSAQRASIRFTDGTTLHINQRTDATLRSASTTYVAQGEVDEIVIPGTKHRVRTSAAVAAAIGTVFDVQVNGSLTTVIVAEGVVKVTNKAGTVLVKANQQTTVQPGQRPSPPAPANPQSATSWTQGIPAPTGNLLTNGNAESGPGAKDDSTQVPVPGWTTTGTFTAAQYGVSSFPSATDPGPADRGKNFFAGGPGGAVSTATQTVPLSSFASRIDGSQLTAYLSAYLGGWDGQDDNATATVTFQDAAHHALQQLKLGPTLSADRHGQTALIAWHGSVHVPHGTRFAQVVMRMTRTSGSYNDGYADNLSLILEQP